MPFGGAIPWRYCYRFQLLQRVKKWWLIEKQRQDGRTLRCECKGTKKRLKVLVDRT